MIHDAGPMIDLPIKVISFTLSNSRMLNLGLTCSCLKASQNDKINMRLISLYTELFSSVYLALLPPLQLSSSLFDEQLVFIVGCSSSWIDWIYGHLFRASLNFCSELSPLKRM